MKNSTMRDGVIPIGLRGLTENEGMIALCDYLPSFHISGGGGSVSTELTINRNLY